MPDKRSHNRFPLRGIVKIKTESEPLSMFQGDLINIGFRGFGMYVKDKGEVSVHTDDIIRFELVAYLWRVSLLGKGRIRGMNESGKYGMRGMRIGVEFVDMDKREIMLYISRIRTKMAREKALKYKDNKDVVF